MKKVIFILYIVVSIILLFYVSLPNLDFPAQIPDSIQSSEPGDIETPLRRAYYTDHTRAEVLEWYTKQFSYSKFLNLHLPTYLLNYPPEEAQSLIRDQTKSTFLQEIVHPFRETLFVNGFEPGPDKPQYQIVINGTHYNQRIVIKLVPSNTLVRFIIMLATLTLIPFLYLQFEKSIKSIFKLYK